MVLDWVSGDVSRPNQILQFNNMEEGRTMSTIFTKPGSPAASLALPCVEAEPLSDGVGGGDNNNSVMRFHLLVFLNIDFSINLFIFYIK